MSTERQIKLGDIVVVKKGAEVRSSYPGRDTFTLTRNQKVKVCLFLIKWSQDGHLHHAEISWAGRGGYWCYAKLTDVI
jgi:hypothetical protein